MHGAGVDRVNLDSTGHKDARDSSCVCVAVCMREEGTSSGGMPSLAEDIRSVHTAIHGL